MIKNELEYQVSQEWVKKFEQSIVEIENDKKSQINDPDRWKMNRETLQSHLEQLQEEIAEYERLINWDKRQLIQIKISHFSKLPDALIKARIAAKISHKELSQILEIDEQRVKQYEDTDYQCASFVEILEVSTALGIEFETAVMRVDFEEIEAVKQSSEKWRKEKITVNNSIYA